MSDRRMLNAMVTNLHNILQDWTFPTQDDDKAHAEWYAFAKNHAPELQPKKEKKPKTLYRQTTPSRISSTCLMYAAHHGFGVNDRLDIRVDQHPYIVPAVKRSLFKADVSKYLKSIDKSYPWVTSLIALALELEKMYKELERIQHVVNPRIYTEVRSLLVSLDDEEMFHPGTLIDALLDYDTCIDTAKTLKKTAVDLLEFL
jgi:hypothetical protein